MARKFIAFKEMIKGELDPTGFLGQLATARIQQKKNFPYMKIMLKLYLLSVFNEIISIAFDRNY